MNIEQLNKLTKEDIIDLYLDQVNRRDQDASRHSGERQEDGKIILRLRTKQTNLRMFNTKLCKLIGKLPHYL